MKESKQFRSRVFRDRSTLEVPVTVKNIIPFAVAQLEEIIVGLYPVHFLEERICVLPSLKILSMDFLMKFFNNEVSLKKYGICSS